MTRHTISVLMEDQPGVLARVVGLISGRGYNIDTLNVAPTQEPTVSRLTMTIPGDDRVLEQAMKQLNKLVDVIKVTDLTRQAFVHRELLMAKIAVARGKRSEIVELASLFSARVVSVGERHMIVQMVDDEDRINEFMQLLKPYGVADVARTGVTALAKE